MVPNGAACKSDSELPKGNVVSNRKSISPRLNLAMIFISDDKPAAAEDVLKPIVKDKFAHPDVLAVMALIHVRQKQFSVAEDKIEKTLKLVPDHPVALVALAELKASDGEHGRAQAILEEALKSNPQNVLVLERLAGHYLTNGDSKQAHQLASRAVALAPDSFAASKICALALARQGQIDEAMSILDALAAPGRESSDQRIAMLKGEIIESSTNAKESLTFYSDLVKKHPGNFYYISRWAAA